MTPGVLKPPQTAVGIYCHLQAPHGTASPSLRRLCSAFGCSEETPLCISGLSTGCLDSLKTAVMAGETVRCVKASATKTDRLSLTLGLTRWKEGSLMPLAVFCLHWCAVASSLPTPYTQAHKINRHQGNDSLKFHGLYTFTMEWVSNVCGMNG